MPVVPSHLRFTVEKFKIWFRFTGRFDQKNQEWEIESPEPSVILDDLVQQLRIDEGNAVALLKRAMALMNYCAEALLPESLFDSGLPGDLLCRVAATATVMDVSGEVAITRGHVLDPIEMRKALGHIWS
jgi:hypothetical protein